MQDLLTVAGLTLPTREVVETDAFAEWQRAGCPRNNSWDADWFRAEDRATDFVAKQLYWRRRCPLGADNQNWKFAQLLVRTVLLAHEVWLKRRGKGNTLSSPSMNSGYYLSALGFVLT